MCPLTFLFFFFYYPLPPRDLPSFPTRPSSDLATHRTARHDSERSRPARLCRWHAQSKRPVLPNRKSTRLNSSHLGISYAVFCLKKKIKIYLRLSTSG